MTFIQTEGANMRRVMCKHSHGSVGTVDDRRNENGRMYITWCYGKDIKGEFITSTQGYPRDRNDLMDIKESDYQDYVNCSAWSPEQDKIRERITGIPRINESKRCRDCRHWGADLDDEYCAHPKTAQFSIVGVNLSRARGDISRKPDKPEDDGCFGICGPEGILWEQREQKVQRAK